MTRMACALVLVALLPHDLAYGEGESPGPRLAVTPPDQEAPHAEGLQGEQSAELALAIRRLDTNHGDRWIDVTEQDVLYARDAIELCVRGRPGYITVWSFTDTKADQLWAGPLERPGVCLGSDGPQRLWIGYGGESTEFAVFWSDRKDVALEADSFVPRLGAVRDSVASGDAPRDQISRVVDVLDRERETRP